MTSPYVRASACIVGMGRRIHRYVWSAEGSAGPGGNAMRSCFGQNGVVGKGCYGAVMPLARSVLIPDGGEARAYVLFLHGILGTGGNLRTLARRALEGTGLGAILVDLRMHGRSQGFDAPHTVARAAADLDEISRELPVSAVVGHSFGGKVALSFLDRGGGAAPRQVVLLDSSPGKGHLPRGPDGTAGILEALTALPASLPSREAFLQHLVNGGVAAPVAAWLAMNLVRGGEGFRFSLDLTAIRALIEDYFAIDLWPLVEDPPPGSEITVVAGGRSDALSAEDQSRVRAADARTGGRTRLRVLPGAGHWVHVDDPDGVVAILREALGPLGAGIG